MPDAMTTLQILGSSPPQGMPPGAPPPMTQDQPSISEGLQQKLDILSGKTTVAPQAKSPAEEAAREPVGTGEDVLRSVVERGIPEGAAAASSPGLLTNSLRLGEEGGQWIGRQLYKHDLIPRVDNPQHDDLYNYGGGNFRIPFTDKYIPATAPTSHDLLETPVKAISGEGLYEPQTTPGKFARTASEFITAGRLMGMKPGAPDIPPTVQPSRLAKIGAEVKTALPSAAAGLLSEAAGQVMQGTPYEGIARAGGALLGGAGAGAMSGATRNIGRKMNEMGIGEKTQIAPGLQATQEQQAIAGERIRNAATDPEKLQQTLDIPKGFDQLVSIAKNSNNIDDFAQAATKLDVNNDVSDWFMKQYDDGSGDQRAATQRFMDDVKSGNFDTKSVFNTVPGSQPTLAEIAQDPGITQWQDALRSQNRDRFLQRSTEQNIARNEAIKSVGGTGDSTAVGSFFTQRLNELERNSDDAIAAAQEKVQSQAEALGGHITPQAAGAAVRSEIEAASIANKAQTDQLWKALRPYDAAVVDGTQPHQMTFELQKSVNAKAGQTLTPEEDRIYSAVQGWTDHPTFGTLRDLRSEIGEAKRSLRMSYGNESRPMRRLGQFQNSVDQAIDDAVNGITNVEAQQIQAGKLAPEQGLANKLAQLRDEWYAQQNAAAQQITARSGGSEGIQGYPSGSTQAFPRMGGAESATARRPGIAQGNQGVSSEAQSPINFDQNAQQLYEEARKATLNRKQTYGQGSVGQALAPGKGGAQYRVQDSNVASLFFNSRDASPENIQSFVKATGGKPQAIEALKDAAVSNLRASAITPTGLIDARAFDAWSKRNSKALSVFPELKTQLSEARAAQDALDEAIATRRTQVEDFNKSRAASFIKDDPIVAVGKALRSGNSKETFTQLYNQVKDDPDALAGLKRATADYVMRNVRGSIEGDAAALDISTPKKFHQFLNDNREALKVLYGGQGVNNLERVAADMRRTAYASKAGKLPGQSNTAQDALNVAKQMEPQKLSILGRIAQRMASTTSGAVVGGYLGGWPGAAVGATAAEASNLYSSIRAAGIQTIEQLQLEAALNPELAAQLTRTIAAKKIPVPVQNRIGTILMKTVPATAASAVGANAEKGE